MSILVKYRVAVEYVESFSNSSIRKNIGKDKKDLNFFIKRTQYFLDLLGNPEKDFYYIHVTGTAGKGTVSTTIQEILTASGKKTGLFTSPYVTTSIEKIRIGGMYISPEEFVAIVEYLKPFIATAHTGPYGGPSSFELFFTIALIYFRQQKCQWVVLEVGFGGRYDATNIISRPVVTAITNIDYDHTDFLGKTLREIATDKMGIIKPESSFFTSEQRPSLQRLFQKTCRDVGAKFFAIKHQRNYFEYNQELVKTIARSLGITDEYIDKGIHNTQLPCRFEIMQKNPVIVLDGAHNRAKIRSTIHNLQNCTFKKLYIIATISDTKKDNRAILEPLLSLPYSTHIVFTQVKKGDRSSVSPTLLMSIARKYQKNKRSKTTLEIIENPHYALESIKKNAHENDFILVTGSFFLAGELRNEWISEDWVLQNRRSF